MAHSVGGLQVVDSEGQLVADSLPCLKAQSTVDPWIKQAGTKERKDETPVSAIGALLVGRVFDIGEGFHDVAPPHEL